jgi:hypothetical protein
VIPRAWQQSTEAARITAPARNREGLFDARTVPLCRTGHGNVHFWLVRAMRAYRTVVDERGIPVLDAIDEAWRAVGLEARKRGGPGAPHHSDQAIARLGMERWQEAGGFLLDLCHAELFGTI